MECGLTKEWLLGAQDPESLDSIDSDGGAGGRSRSSFLQAVFNNVGVLVGLGMLSCAYALEQGGWIGLAVLFLCAVLFCSTSIMLGLCLGIKPGVETYQQVGALAFGSTGRILVAAIVDLELLSTLVGFTISLRDNLVRIFPHTGLRLSWLQLAPSQLLPILGVLVVLPVIWMEDLSWISYVSLSGIASYLFVVGGVLWAGVADRIGFHHSISFVNPGNLARVTGLYAFCFSGHLVVPRIYSSMKDPSQYPKVAVLSISIATIIYVVVAVSGATMFGSSIKSQVTLSLPTDLPVAKTVLWVVVLIPLTKYALVVNPLAVHLESIIARRSRLSAVSSVTVRTAIMAVVLTLALLVPAFETTIALIGSGISVTTCVILPAVFYVKIFGPRGLSKFQVVITAVVGSAGLVMAIVGTVSSVRKLLN